ncbi:MAG: fibronectin type III domain-containing protein [Nitrospira sp.]|jgi:hypothetical protein|nr:fibronectin type III domain-containing protein [Nitrospira sp.]
MGAHITHLRAALSSSKRDSTLSRFSLGKHHPAAGCQLLLQSVAACLVIITATLLTGCAGGGEGAPSISSTPGTSSVAGATATLAWDPVADPTVSGYYVHYGTQSPGQSGSCSYQYSQFVSSPTATVANLSRNTTYYFAVSAYNGLESACSTEVATTTPI